VLAKIDTGLAATESPAINDGCAHRIASAWVASVLKGGIQIFSVYLINTVGINEANKKILDAIAATILTLSGPWIISGDWNVNPDVLIGSGFLARVNGVVVAPANPTCNDNTYDYFVVCRSLSHAVVGAQRVDGIGFTPHRPVRLLLRGDARRFAVRTIVRPKRVPARLPHGPAIKPPSYDEVSCAADRINNRPIDQPLPDETAVANTAMVNWYTIARKEFTDIAGTDMKFKQTKFKFGPAIPTIASPWAGEYATSAFWRSLATRARDTANLLAKKHRDAAQNRAISHHIKSAPAAIKFLPKSCRAPMNDQLLNRTCALTNAVLKRSPCWVMSLAKLADKRASDVET